MAEDRLIFDRALLRQRCARAALLEPATFLLDHVAAELADRLAAITRRFGLAADIGSPTAAVLHKLATALGVVLAALFESPGPAQNGHGPLSRYEDQPEWRDPESGYVRRNVSPAMAAASVPATASHSRRPPRRTPARRWPSRSRRTLPRPASPSGGST